MCACQPLWLLCVHTLCCFSYGSPMCGSLGSFATWRLGGHLVHHRSSVHDLVRGESDNLYPLWWHVTIAREVYICPCRLLTTTVCLCVFRYVACNAAPRHFFFNAICSHVFVRVFRSGFGQDKLCSETHHADHGVKKPTLVDSKGCASRLRTNIQNMS